MTATEESNTDLDKINSADLTKSILEENCKKLDALQSDINAALAVDDILHTLSLSGFDYVNAHITRLRKLSHEDGYDDLVDLKSMKNFALFLVNHSNIPRPHIGITLDGFIDARWDIPKYATLVLEFLPDDEISFVAIFDEHESTHKLPYVNGRSSSKNISKHIDFTASIIVITE